MSYSSIKAFLSSCSILLMYSSFLNPISSCLTYFNSSSFYLFFATSVLSFSSRLQIFSITFLSSVLKRFFSSSRSLTLFLAIRSSSWNYLSNVMWSPSENFIKSLLWFFWIFFNVFTSFCNSRIFCCRLFIVWKLSSPRKS